MRTMSTALTALAVATVAAIATAVTFTSDNPVPVQLTTLTVTSDGCGYVLCSNTGTLTGPGGR